MLWFQNQCRLTLLDEIAPLAHEWHRLCLVLASADDMADEDWCFRRLAEVEELLDEVWERRRVALAREYQENLPAYLAVDPFERRRDEFVHVPPLS